MMLRDLVIESARRTPDALAVNGPDGALSYRELDELANWLAWDLAALGVGPGQRVGIWLDKSGRAIAAMQACLRLGAAYVPLDPLSPAARVLMIIEDCAFVAIVTTSQRATGIADELRRFGVASLSIEDAGRGESREPRPLPPGNSDDLAYILYTSGSTGRPKGVCISQTNALAFIRWAAVAITASEGDRFANHAPFHFDLSVFDLYVAFAVGASVSLIPEGMSYLPGRLVSFIREQEITVWYSVPSALILMMQSGGLLDVTESRLRCIVFAGEPFPVKPLRMLRQRWTEARLFNFYGPTETNVCTCHEVHEIAADRVHPVPIGTACAGDEVWAVTSEGQRCQPGEQGELMVQGPTVMLGYWGQPPHGSRAYATGDIVRWQHDGEYAYVGRADHMVKVRGHRVELGEIEVALQQHHEVREAAVILQGAGVEARLLAFLVVSSNELSLLAVKQHCAARLPRYMIVDDVQIITALPRTGNGKVDRIALAREADAVASRVRVGQQAIRAEQASD